MIYLILFLFIAVCCYEYDYKQNNKGKLFCWIVLLVSMICVAGFRYKMGIDSIMYENYYHWQHTLPELRADDFKDTRFAPFYVILSTVCRTITYDFMLLQFVIAIIVNVTVFYFLWKNATHIFVAVLLYYLMLYINLNMEVLREALAVCVFLIAWPYFRDGRWMIYYVLSVVAFMFHLSAIVMFVLPVVCAPGVKWFFTFGMRTWFICALILLVSFIIQNYFFGIVKMLALTESMAERADVYSKTSLSTNSLNLVGIISHLIKNVIYPVLAMYFINKMKGKAGVVSDNTLLKKEMLAIVAVYFSLMTIGVPIFLRYRNYFMFFSILMIADWVFSLQRTKTKLVRVKMVYWVLAFVPLFFFQINYYFSDLNKSGTLKTYMLYYPYSNRIDEYLTPERAKAIRYRPKL